MLGVEYCARHGVFYEEHCIQCLSGFAKKHKVKKTRAAKRKEQRKKNRNYSIRQSARRAVFKRDGWKCLRCRGTKDLTIDHIKPRGLGGVNAQSNLQTLCKDCNEYKGMEEIDYRVRMERA